METAAAVISDRKRKCLEMGSVCVSPGSSRGTSEMAGRGSAQSSWGGFFVRNSDIAPREKTWEQGCSTSSI